MLSMGKSTISTGPFSIAMLDYQRVHVLEVFISWNWIIMYIDILNIYIYIHVCVGYIS